MIRKLANNWLNFLGLMIPEAREAIIMVLDRDTHKAKAMARWPDQAQQWQEFEKIIRYTLKKKSKVCMQKVGQVAGESSDLFAVPLAFHTDFTGVLSLRTTSVSASRQQQVFALLEQSMDWLKLFVARQSESDLFYATAMGVLASCIEQSSYDKALFHLAAELAKKVDCERVAIGEYNGKNSTVVTFSDNAQFDGKANIVKTIADAMDEAIEQDSAVLFPGDDKQLIKRDHTRLAVQHGYGAIYTRPLAHQGQLFGAVTFLTGGDRTFTASSVEMCEQILAFVTPFLVLKKNDEKPLLGKMLTSLQQNLQSLLGFKYVKSKCLVLGILMVLTTASIVEGDFRVTAESVLEGKVQRVIASPISGFLVSVSARAGDTVYQGELLASLDTADLELEIGKQQGELQKLRREFREALANVDLVKIQIVKAQIRQTEAELDLLHGQLQKTDLVAPFDGIIIEGDLSQRLGSPVERGDSLLKIAPLLGYRIILKVDEQSIAHVKPGQQGVLTLTSFPDRQFNLLVEKITEAAQPGEGANIFRVEASLEDNKELLRPGMEGVGKIHIGRAKLIWIWTHDMIEWLRLKFWSWKL